MRLKFSSLTRLVLLCAVVVPLVAWFAVKPVRVIAPWLLGLSCSAGPVCVEDPAMRVPASQLVAHARAFVDATVSPLEGQPRMIFCSTPSCADSFGLGARSAVTLGTSGTVIGPRAWKDYYVRHELIHHLQGQRLGVLNRLFRPTWFVEGMAYALSEDPRMPLSEPFEGYRREFLVWLGAIHKDTMWAQADKL